MKRFAVLFFLFISPHSLWSSAQVTWFHDFDQALVQAKKHSRPVFVDAYADWCGWCHRLDREVYAHPKFVKFMEQFVPVKIDVDDNAEGTRFAEIYEIHGLPTLLVTDANGNLTNRIGGYMDVDSLIGDLRIIQQLVDKEQKDPNNDGVRFALAREYLSREMYPQAEIRFGKVLESENAALPLKENARFSIALAQYHQGKLEMALQSLETYLAAFTDGESGEDALLLISEIYLETDSPEEARHYLNEFLKRYPNSGNVNRAQEVLAAIERKQ